MLSVNCILLVQYLTWFIHTHNMRLQVTNGTGRCGQLIFGRQIPLDQPNFVFTFLLYFFVPLMPNKHEKVSLGQNDAIDRIVYKTIPRANPNQRGQSASLTARGNLVVEEYVVNYWTWMTKDIRPNQIPLCSSIVNKYKANQFSSQYENHLSRW